MAIWHPWLNIECIRLRIFDDFLAAAMRAFLNNNSSATATFVTRRLCLGKHAREDLLFRNLDTCASTRTTCMNVAVGCCTRTATVVAENVLLYGKLLEVSQLMLSIPLRPTSKLAPVYLVADENARASAKG